MTSLAVGLPFLAAGLGLAQLVARGITRPIVSLLGLAAAADHGDVDGPAVPALGLPEADRLATALLAEARRRRAALAALLDGERRLRLVVAELNHRAKNALATVQALALQTARSEGGDPARFTETFTARLQTLGRAHDLLARLAWEGAALGAILRAGLAPWLDAAGSVAPPRILLCDSCDAACRWSPQGRRRRWSWRCTSWPRTRRNTARCRCPRAGSRSPAGPIRPGTR